MNINLIDKDKQPHGELRDYLIDLQIDKEAQNGTTTEPVRHTRPLHDDL